MSADYTYDYAIIRVVPRVERGEQLNAGVILSCPEVEFLEARIQLDEAAVLALDPGADLEALRANLATIPLVCRGSAAASAGWSHRGAPSSSRPRCTRAAPKIQPRAWST